MHVYIGNKLLNNNVKLESFNCLQLQFILIQVFKLNKYELKILTLPRVNGFHSPLYCCQ